MDSGFRVIIAALVIVSAGCAGRQASFHSSDGAQFTGEAQRDVPRIESFLGEYRFLSNFWPAPVEFEGIFFPSVEHAYQAAKSLDVEERRRIAAIVKPGDAKRAGRAVALRPDWEQVKLRVMEECVRYKFTHQAELREKLLATGDTELIEGNTWNDRFWGVCDGQGENHMGRILMKVRAELRGPLDDGIGLDE